MIAMLRMSFGISSHPYRWCLQATLAVAWPPLWAIYSPSNRCNLETWTFLRPWLLGNHPTGRSTSRIWLVRWRCRTAPARVPWAWETWTETIQTCSVCHLMFGIFFVAWSNGLYFWVLFPGNSTRSVDGHLFQGPKAYLHQRPRDAVVQREISGINKHSAVAGRIVRRARHVNVLMINGKNAFKRYCK